MSGVKGHAGQFEFRYRRVSPTNLGKINGHELPMSIDTGSVISVVSEEVAGELNIRWKCADWKMIMADGNWSQLTNVTESVPVNICHIIIPKPICFAKSGSQQVILGRPWESYGPKCDRNLDDGSCEMTISAVDRSE
jgi:hypothetical protein